MRRLHRQKARRAASFACTSFVAAVVTIVSPSAGYTQVIEIGPDGARTISGPSVVSSDGARPIRMPAQSASASKPALSSQASARQAAAAPILDRAGKAVDLSPRLLEAIAYVESRFNAKAISPKGAVGMMQIMPGTAGDLGVNPHDPEQNARGGADYLRQMLARFDNNVELAVAAYNAGPAAVTRYGGVPPFAETKAYVAAVMDYLATTSLPETSE